jgi:hypothetical protein
LASLMLPQQASRTCCAYIDNMLTISQQKQEATVEMP